MCQYLIEQNNVSDNLRATNKELTNWLTNRINKSDNRTVMTKGAEQLQGSQLLTWRWSAGGSDGTWPLEIWKRACQVTQCSSKPPRPPLFPTTPPTQIEWKSIGELESYLENKPRRWPLDKFSRRRLRCVFMCQRCVTHPPPLYAHTHTQSHVLTTKNMLLRCNTSVRAKIFILSGV